MMTVKQLRDNSIAIRRLREGIDTSNATCRMIAGVLASLPELELELQRERKAAARAARQARGLPIGRPRALDPDKAALARRMQTASPADRELLQARSCGFDVDQYFALGEAIAKVVTGGGGAGRFLIPLRNATRRQVPPDGNRR